jgi:hypothetical protein
VTTSVERTQIAAFTDAFIKDRRALIANQGAEAFDQAQTLYVCTQTGKSMVVRDGFTGAGRGAATDLIAQVQQTWWAQRARFRPQVPDTDFQPVAGLYARYLGEVGFDWMIAFEGQAALHCWRVAARGDAVQIALPTDELMFRDQTGTFLDPRAGWRALVAEHLQTGQPAVYEVQSGYIIGARAGVPGDPDPAAREDEELMSHFSRWDPREYDVLEFINAPDADLLGLVGGRHTEWLPEPDQAVDLFALADSSALVECVVDLAGVRQVSVQVIDEGERLWLSRGSVSATVDLGGPVLRCLHGGRSFVDGARAFFLPTITAIDEAFDLLEALRQRIQGYGVRVEHGRTLLITEPNGQVVGRWNLLGLAGRQTAHGEDGMAELMAFLGYDPTSQRFAIREDRLDRCPICGSHARVEKIVRPKALLGVDPRTLAGVEIGDHIVYYTLVCPHHVVPLDPQPGRDLTTLEAAYQDGLGEARTVITQTKETDDGLLIVGYDTGSLVLSPERMKGVLQALDHPATGRPIGYGFLPDAVFVAHRPLEGGALSAARQLAEDAVRGRFVGRDYPLDVARRLDLDDVQAVGEAIVAEGA